MEAVEMGKLKAEPLQLAEPQIPVVGVVVVETTPVLEHPVAQAQ